MSTHSFFTDENKEKQSIAQNIEAALKQGWDYKDVSPDLEGIYSALNRMDTVKFAIGQYFQTLANEYMTVSKIPLPFSLLLALNSEEVKECEHYLSSLFSSKSAYSDSYTDINDCVTLTAHYFQEDFVTNKTDDKATQNKPEIRLWMICEIVNTIGKPDSIDLSINNNPTRLEYPTDKYRDIVDQLVNKRFSLSFVDGYSIYMNWHSINTFLAINLYSSGYVNKLELSTSNPKTSIQEPLKGKVAMDLTNNSSLGSFKNTFPLNSFHEEARQLETHLDEKLNEGIKKFTTLIYGEPGTGKTEWVKSYIANKLKHQGFFTFFLDANTIKNFSPPVYLPKVCIFVNEFDNIVPDRSYTYGESSGEVEALLGFFDGTVFNSVKEDGQSDIDQTVLTFLTANTTERLDEAFKRKGRVDLFYQFQYKYLHNNC